MRVRIGHPGRAAVEHRRRFLVGVVFPVRLESGILLVASAQAGITGVDLGRLTESVSSGMREQGFLRKPELGCVFGRLADPLA